MALDTIVIDNTVFNFFLKIQSVDLSNILRNTISGRVLVPSEIVNEMDGIVHKYPQYSIEVEKLKNQIANNKFFLHCHSFDSVVLEIAKEKIDKGEAEAVAQCMKRRVSYFITDDFKSQPFISKNYPNINIRSTFFLLAVADLHGLIKDYKQVFSEYHKILDFKKMTIAKKTKHKERIQDEYSKAAQLFGIALSKSEIAAKTSFK